MTGAPEGARRLEITGIHHLTLISRNLERTVAFYRDVLGLRVLDEGTSIDDPAARHFALGAGEGAPGAVITFLEYPDMEEGKVGAGSTHHLALAVGTDHELEGWRAWLGSQGLQSTEVLDRGHCRSIYVRDPDGHIVELATPGPGFAPRGPESAP